MNLKKGTSLVEVLVSITIVMVLLGIMIPTLVKARQKARSLRTMNNQRQIVISVTAFSTDNHGKYPESVAKIGRINHWNWQEPTMLTSIESLDGCVPRSVSGYLRSYISEASVMVSPNAPEKYEYLQEAWDAGDDWDNPETLVMQDSVIGTYCFYWGYTGLLEGRAEAFEGPKRQSGGSSQSTLLVSDYFGYNHWRNPQAYQSCERFTGAGVRHGTWVSPDLWSRRSKDGDAGLGRLRIELHAGYTDGHVGRYGPSEVTPMKVSMTPDGTVSYPDSIAPGDFYLPVDAL